MQLRGFGMMMDLERGTMRAWYVGNDGIKRWADNDARVDQTNGDDKTEISRLESTTQQA